MAKTEAPHHPAHTPNKCFAIMPIADQDGYPIGHFTQVYQNIIVPACDLAGYKAIRADEVHATNLIHLDILKKLIEAPIAICDLSSRNPNVLFELGIRQAFDRPVVLIQEAGTPRIFDITPLRYLEYSREMKYHDVLKTQKALQASIEATAAAEHQEGNINSIVKLLALASGPAKLPELLDDGEGMSMKLMQAEMREMRKAVENMSRSHSPWAAETTTGTALQHLHFAGALEALTSARSNLKLNDRIEQLRGLVHDIEKAILSGESGWELMPLLEKTQNALMDCQETRPSNAMRSAHRGGSGGGRRVTE